MVKKNQQSFSEARNLELSPDLPCSQFGCFCSGEEWKNFDECTVSFDPPDQSSQAGKRVSDNSHTQVVLQFYLGPNERGSGGPCLERIPCKRTMSSL